MQNLSECLSSNKKVVRDISLLNEKLVISEVSSIPKISDLKKNLANSILKHWGNVSTGIYVALNFHGGTIVRDSRLKQTVSK